MTRREILLLIGGLSMADKLHVLGQYTFGAARAAAAELLRRQEGFRAKPYDDAGEVSIGFGRCLTQRGISPEEAELMLENDLIEDLRILKTIFSDEELMCMHHSRRVALLSMAHQLGPGLGGFRKMIAAIKRRDWAEAEKHALDSKWARQTPKRARQIAKALRTAGFSELTQEV